MEIFKVGGSVRDKILGRKSSDNDYIVFGSNEKELLKAFPGIKKVGKKKPVYIFSGDEYIISDFKNIHEDLNSRDLTINAVAEDSKGEIFSHEKSLQDIENKILRPVSLKNFIDDPARTIRAARFAASFPDFMISHELVDTMKIIGEKNLLRDIPPERISKEIIKAFSSAAPQNFFYLLSRTNCLNPWFNEFSLSHEIPAGPFKFHGTNSVLQHTMDIMEKLKGDPLLVWMGFCHDIGKNFTDKNILPSHHDHDNKGDIHAKNLGHRLKMPKKYINAGSTAAKLHMKAGKYQELRPSTKVRLLLELNKKNILKEIFQLVKADKNLNFYETAKRDLGLILKVKLPDNKKGMGKKSGEILFQLQCQELKRLGINPAFFKHSLYETKEKSIYRLSLLPLL